MNKTVFVTGATAGTGYAIAERFAKEGYSVVITSRDKDSAEAAAKNLAEAYGVTAKGYKLNMLDENSVIEVFKDMDEQGLQAETVVLNAADLGFGKDPAKGQDFFTVDIDEVSKVFETNLLGNYKIVRQAAMRMREKGKGAVVFISSNTAYRAIPNRAAYCASKGGMISLTKALAVDLGPFGIRCNVVLPGTIKTERWKAMGDKQIVNGELTPIGDISDYEDIAEAAWYFGTDASKNVTGAELNVDGGMSCQLYPVKLNEWKRIAKEQQEN